MVFCQFLPCDGIVFFSVFYPINPTWKRKQFVFKCGWFVCLFIFLHSWPIRCFLITQNLFIHKIISNSHGLSAWVWNPDRHGQNIQPSTKDLDHPRSKPRTFLVLGNHARQTAVKLTVKAWIDKKSSGKKWLSSWNLYQILLVYIVYFFAKKI